MRRGGAVASSAALRAFEAAEKRSSPPIAEEGARASTYFSSYTACAAMDIHSGPPHIVVGTPVSEDESAGSGGPTSRLYSPSSIRVSENASSWKVVNRASIW